MRVSSERTSNIGSNPPSYKLFKSKDATFVGSSLSLESNGHGCVSAAQGGNLGFGGNFSISFWLYGDNFGGTQNILEVGDFYIEWRFSDNIRIGNYGGPNLGGGVVNGQRTFVVFTLASLGSDDYQSKLYLNGSLVDSQLFNNSSMPTYATDTLSLFGGNFKGRLDALAFYSKTLDSDDIIDMYDGGNGKSIVGTEDELIYGWNFDEGEGTTAAEVNGELVPFTSVDVWGEGIVSSNQSTGVIIKSFSSSIEQEVYFSVQIPHSWKAESSLRPHIHWTPLIDGDEGDLVCWGLEYTWSNYLDSFSNTNIIYNNVANNNSLINSKHIITQLPEMNAIGKTLSSMIICRLFRDSISKYATDNYDGEAGFLEIDFHYQIDSMGSRNEYVK